MILNADPDDTKLDILLSYYNPVLEQYGIAPLRSSDFIPSKTFPSFGSDCMRGEIKITFSAGTENFTVAAPAGQWETAKSYALAFINCNSPAPEEIKKEVIPKADVREIGEGLSCWNYMYDDAADEWSYSRSHNAQLDWVVFFTEQMSFGIDKPAPYC